MKRAIPLLLALAIGCATGSVVRDVIAPARAQGQTGLCYAYQVVNAGNDPVEQQRVLSQYGKQGWRLTTMGVTGFRMLMYFEAGGACR